MVLMAIGIVGCGSGGDKVTDTVNEGDKTYNTTIYEENTTLIPEDKGDVVIISGANGVYVDDGGVYVICGDEGCGNLLIGSETNDSDSSTNGSYNSDDDVDSNDDNSDNSDNSTDNSTDISDNSDNSQDIDVDVDINCTVDCEDENLTATPK